MHKLSQLQHSKNTESITDKHHKHTINRATDVRLRYILRFVKKSLKGERSLFFRDFYTGKVGLGTNGKFRSSLNKNSQKRVLTMRIFNQRNTSGNQIYYRIILTADHIFPLPLLRNGGRSRESSFISTLLTASTVLAMSR